MKIMVNGNNKDVELVFNVNMDNQVFKKIVMYNTDSVIDDRYLYVVASINGDHLEKIDNAEEWKKVTDTIKSILINKTRLNDSIDEKNYIVDPGADGNGLQIPINIISSYRDATKVNNLPENIPDTEIAKDEPVANQAAEPVVSPENNVVSEPVLDQSTNTPNIDISQPLVNDEPVIPIFDNTNDALANPIVTDTPNDEMVVPFVESTNNDDFANQINQELSSDDSESINQKYQKILADLARIKEEAESLETQIMKRSA